MEENLVIVESPAKAKTIEKFLGKDYLVKSSFGHIRDLSKKNLGIDLTNKFKPDYIVSDDKKQVVAELKKLAKAAKTVWLASDEDREGEAIAWHLAEVLELREENTRRIVFNEITKPAIQKAIQNPRKVDRNLVNAQQARRILDRLVGFEISPLLWKKVRPQLSAGRVQSVAVRLIVEREREIMAFAETSAYRVVAQFELTDEKGKKYNLQAEFPERFKTLNEAQAFLEACKDAQYSIKDIAVKPGKKTPAPPFTTSTLQQEASRKLGFSVAQTMTVAQRLYEAGKITYMRTDSVNLSDTALAAAKEAITNQFGDKYLNIKQYKTKTKGAQEAHEAIRPTYFDNDTISGSATEKKLYELIWKRAIASQMSDAVLEKTTVTIGISTHKGNFIANGEVIKFDGFLRVYLESSDEESDEEDSSLLPPMKVNQVLVRKNITASERFTHHPARYTEASLVKKLEELGIGRPSTYAPTISTVLARGYVSKEDRAGTERKFNILTLVEKEIKKELKSENTGAEKSKLFPSDIGMIVNDFLLNHFHDVLEFNFTASVEKQFDEIADGKLVWNEMIEKFYVPFHQHIEKALSSKEYSVGERQLGNDPATGLPVIAKMGKFGPMVQLGVTEGELKPRYASLQSGQYLEKISLEQALSLLSLPRKIGQYEDADMTVAIGRFGPYVQHKSAFYSLQKDVDDPYTIEADRAIILIEEKREKDKNKLIMSFTEEPELQVLNGRWGPYIAYKKENYKIPKTVEVTTLNLETCLDIIKNAPKTPSKFSKKSTAKAKAPAKAASKSKTEKTKKTKK
jgi:DNA topoisomerase-1